jgi:hypothetical protein
MQPKISPEARRLILDVWDAPHTYCLYTLDADGDLVDMLDDFTDREAAQAAAQKTARDTGMQLFIQHTPPGITSDPPRAAAPGSA